MKGPCGGGGKCGRDQVDARAGIELGRVGRSCTTDAACCELHRLKAVNRKDELWTRTYGDCIAYTYRMSQLAIPQHTNTTSVYILLPGTVLGPMGACRDSGPSLFNLPVHTLCACPVDHCPRTFFAVRPSSSLSYEGYAMVLCCYLKLLEEASLGGRLSFLRHIPPLPPMVCNITGTHGMYLF